MATKARSGLDSVHRAFVDRVRELTAKHRWSTNQLADFSGVARGNLSDILAAKRSPTLRTIVKLATALEVDVKDLFG